MDDRRLPVSLGDRLSVVALVCGAATALVLGTNLVFALVTDVSEGAVASPLRQRLMLVTRPADVELGVVVVIAAAAVALGRWLDGDDPPASDGVGTLVAVAAAVVAALAVVGMFTDVLWRLEGAVWGWYVANVGQRTAAAALGALAVWLARPRRSRGSAPRQRRR